MIYNSQIVSAQCISIYRDYGQPADEEETRELGSRKMSKTINNNRKNEVSRFRGARLSSCRFFARDASTYPFCAYTRTRSLVERTLEAHLDAQRCHWLNEQEAPNEIFLRKFSPTHAGNALQRTDVWIGMALGLSFLSPFLFQRSSLSFSLGRSRKMRLGVHTSSFMRQKPSSHTRCVYESGRIKREVALKPKGCVAPFASFARDFVRKKNFEKEKNIWLFSSTRIEHFLERNSSRNWTS